MNARLLDAALFIARVPLGLFFLRAGWMKIFGMGVGKFVEMGSNMVPSWLGPGLGKPYLYAVPFMEFLVGLLVTAGLITRAAATIMSLMLLSFMIAATGFFPQG